MLHLIEAYRAMMLYGEFPSATSLTGLAITSTILLFIGYKVFQSANQRFVEEL
jgi:ABC-type polysaccharide/polyol phosphate export permease